MMTEMSIKDTEPLSPITFSAFLHSAILIFHVSKSSGTELLHNSKAPAPKYPENVNSALETIMARMLNLARGTNSQ